VQARTGSWADGVRWSLWTAIAFVALALGLAVADRRRRTG
jgi:hypothetical protein